MDFSVHNPYSELFLAFIYLLSLFKTMLCILIQSIILAKKGFCLFINRPNVVKEKAFSEAGFCTLATCTSNAGNDFNRSKLSPLDFYLFQSFLFLRLYRRPQYYPRKASADGKTSGLFF